MPRNSRKQERDGGSEQQLRRRIEGDANLVAEKDQQLDFQEKTLQKGDDSKTIYTDDDSVWEDAADSGILDEVEEEIIVESDDDEYAEFQRESATALTTCLNSLHITTAKTPKGEDFKNGSDDIEVAVWRQDQGDILGEQDKLQYENKAYDFFYQLRTEYPCLSFDVIKDNEGANRVQYPLSMMLVCGSQADEQSKNHLVVLRISNICRTKHDINSDNDSEASYIGDGGESDGDDKDDNDEGEEVNHGEPMVYDRKIHHYGTANRVRCSPSSHTTSASSLENQLVAVWSDVGHVQIFNLKSEVRAFVDFANWTKEQAMEWKEPKSRKESHLKFCTPSSSHKVEGYGLGWSSVQRYAFASGDCNGSFFVWQPSDDGRWKNIASNTTRSASIEEILWSPTQAEVLIVARSGGVVEVWDTRDSRQSKLSWQADPTDINAADWNRARQASHLLVTGAESGAVAIWDLRRLSTAEPIQRLSWHTKSITSVEFSLLNESVLAVTGADGQCTLWDLSLERDPSEEHEEIGELFGRKDLSGFPDQLMFQHQGLTSPKEVHWHSQIPGVVVTTDYEGLHLFKPMNWRSLMK